MDVPLVMAWGVSYNNTHRAIDMIPKDVMICDWHYERPDKSAVYFAMKGLRVATLPGANAEISIKQANDMVSFRKRCNARNERPISGDDTYRVVKGRRFSVRM